MKCLKIFFIFSNIGKGVFFIPRNLRRKEINAFLNQIYVLFNCRVIFQIFTNTGTHTFYLEAAFLEVLEPVLLLGDLEAFVVLVFVLSFATLSFPFFVFLESSFTFSLAFPVEALV